LTLRNARGHRRRDICRLENKEAPMRPVQHRVGPATLAMVFAVGLTAGCAGGAARSRADVPADATPSEARGHVLVRENCGGCHAVEARGVSPNARSPALRTIHRRYPIENLAESMSEGLLNAHTGMPAFTFTSEEATDIMAYLTTLQSSDRRQPLRARRR
jgi:cytochrome c